jgi:thiamine-phosphate pyrophosphorylase
MFPEMTPAVSRAVEAAQRYARARQAAAVEPVDLLHALLEEEEGRAALLLIGAGLDYAAYRSAAGTPSAAEGQPLGMHPEAHVAMAKARDLAPGLSGESTIASDALLLALLRTDHRLGQLLASSGFSAERLEAAVEETRPPPIQPDEALQLSDATDLVHLGRVLDAAANRAREAMRILEDYTRFVLDDAFLTAELKRLRHDVTEAMLLYAPRLLEARNTSGDVGTSLSTTAEQTRESLSAVVRVNSQRLQEALRSLEEFGKVQDPRLGEAMEQVRYRSYTIERALLLAADAQRKLADVRLYALLSAAGCKAALDWTITEAAAGGVQMVQLREKALTDRELLHRARDVRRWTHQAGVLFIVNDRPDIARLVGADGVHLGQDDLPVADARRILGPEAIIGVSTHNLDQLRQAVLDGATYIGVGPTFPSGTKEFGELAGLEFVTQAMAETSLPAFVIGGVNDKTIDAAVLAGAKRVAVSQAIGQADNPRALAAALRVALGSASAR